MSTCPTWITAWRDLESCITPCWSARCSGRAASRCWRRWPSTLRLTTAPPEVEKSGKEEEVDSKVKELVKENSSKEEIIAKDNLGFVGAKVEESESKAKELMPMTYNTVMKELFEVRRGSWNQVQGSTIKQTQMGMGAKDQEEEKLKQKEQIRCSLPSKLRWRGSSPRTRR